MTFTGVNYLAIFVAAIAGWLVGAAWYTTLGNYWMAAQGKSPEQCKQEYEAKKGTPATWAPFVLAFGGALVMAWALAGLVGHFGPGQVTIRNGVVSALFVWLGFVITTMTVNNAFSGRKLMLTVIDGGHWLAALAVMGAVIGAFGV
jgi:uncharacterized protein DUF1761